MALTREQFKSKLNSLLGMASPDHQANASEILTELSDEYETVMTENENTATRVQELTANNETLRSVNAKLFLKVGNADVPPPKEEPTVEPDPEPLKFDTLFNEKGELI